MIASEYSDVTDQQLAAVLPNFTQKPDWAPIRNYQLCLVPR